MNDYYPLSYRTQRPFEPLLQRPYEALPVPGEVSLTSEDHFLPSDSLRRPLGGYGLPTQHEMLDPYIWRVPNNEQPGCVYIQDLLAPPQTSTSEGRTVSQIQPTSPTLEQVSLSPRAVEKSRASRSPKTKTPRKSSGNTTPETLVYTPCRQSPYRKVSSESSYPRDAKPKTPVATPRRISWSKLAKS